MLIIATLALFFELHLQFFLSLHTGIILKCLLFLVPLTHLLSQRGEKSCPADVLFGGILLLVHIELRDDLCHTVHPVGNAAGVAVQDPIAAFK